ncbi:VacJ family lipoprotein [Reinekea sp.]|jgi:phospholipid-binding lipoprotein MlaA|uniref:MlaA family lipoprotein n=1 Tax=Reinekea sp. TaxID=1970455 RepID=UPI00398A3553
MVKRASNSLRVQSLSILLALTLVSAANPIFAASDDPLEPVNRVTHGFNDVLDRFLLKPVAKTYQFIMPEFAERGVRNVFTNLGEVRNVVHNGLQGKGKGAVQSTGRLLINSTVGIGGLFDVASKIGLPVEREDLGQTLGSWGVGPGPYLVVPFFGPSSLRDALGLLADPALNPITYAPISTAEKTGVTLLSAVQTRADLISAEGLISGDKYIIYRQAYLSTREFDVNDGQIKTDDFLDNSTDFDEEDEFLDEGF